MARQGEEEERTKERKAEYCLEERGDVLKLAKDCQQSESVKKRGKPEKPDKT